MTTRRNLGRARLLLCRARDPPTLNPGPARGTRLSFPDDLLERSLDTSMVQALARAQQHPQERGVILEGVPAIPHPADDEDVDTTLCLGPAPPTTRGRQVE